MNTIKIGGIGELQIASELSRQGYFVFKPLTDGSPIDLVALDSSLNPIRIEVKTTTSGRNGDWFVQIKRVRINRNKNKITNFDNTKVDILAVFIEPLNRIVFYRARDIKVRTMLTIKLKDLDNYEFGRLAESG